MAKNKIFEIIMKDQSIPMSWGLKEAYGLSWGLTFKVDGLKFKGDVMIYSKNDQCTKFDVVYIKDDVVIDKQQGVKAKNLVSTIDKYVELVDNYDEARKKWTLEQLSKQVGFDVSGFKNVVII